MESRGAACRGSARALPGCDARVGARNRRGESTQPAVSSRREKVTARAQKLCHEVSEGGRGALALAVGDGNVAAADHRGRGAGAQA